MSSRAGCSPSSLSRSGAAAEPDGGEAGLISVECPDFHCAEVHQVNEALDTEN